MHSVYVLEYADIQKMRQGETIDFVVSGTKIKLGMMPNRSAVNNDEREKYGLPRIGRPLGSYKKTRAIHHANKKITCSICQGIYSVYGIIAHQRACILKNPQPSPSNEQTVEVQP